MKIAVLLSGGVDSSVALALLKEQGHDLTAFYLKIWLEDELAYLGNCPWEEDLSYAEKVCEQFNIPLEIVPLQKVYFEKVVSYAIAEVKTGHTPNPDMLCNQQVKFGVFYDHIDPSFEKVASGHYAQVEDKDGKVALKTAPDPIKDQTYFLAYLKQKQLQRALFPIGHMSKKQVREKAEAFNLPTASRKDSQGICFLGKFEYRDFVRHYLGEKKGDLLEIETGNIVGEHNGYWFYTLGQRKGIGLSGGPWYVVSKDCEKNIVYVSKEYHSDDKVRNSCILRDINWISGTPTDITDLEVKFRHGPDRYACKLSPLDKGGAEGLGDTEEVAPLSRGEDGEGSEISLTIQGNDQGIAPGQFAVLYDGEYCLGGGVIS